MAPLSLAGCTDSQIAKKYSEMSKIQAFLEYGEPYYSYVMLADGSRKAFSDDNRTILGLISASLPNELDYDDYASKKGATPTEGITAIEISYYEIGQINQIYAFTLLADGFSCFVEAGEVLRYQSDVSRRYYSLDPSYGNTIIEYAKGHLKD